MKIKLKSLSLSLFLLLFSISFHSFSQGIIDVGVTAVTEPATICDVSAQTQITITLINSGTVTVNSIPVSYSLNAVHSVSETFTGTLQPGASALFSFNTKANLPSTSGHSITVQTHMPNDANFSNDMAVHNVSARPSPPVLFAQGPTSFCQGDSVRIMITNNTSGTFTRLYLDGVQIVWGGSNVYIARDAGILTAKAHNSITCASDPSNPIVIAHFPAPTPPVITQNGSLLSANTASGNQWYRNGIAISGAVNQTYQVTANGSYTATTTSNNCSSAASNTITVINTGLKEQAAKNNFRVYPNPAMGSFRLVLPAGNTFFTASLFNLAGQELKTNQIAPSEKDILIQVPEIAAGTYLLKLASEKEVFVTRLVLQ